MTGRPSAPLLMSGQDAYGRPTDILIAEKLFAVCLNGQPITLRSTANKTNYPKTIFPHPGHARRLAKQLNDVFSTEGFTVRPLVVGPEA